MPDVFTKAKRSEVMSRIRSRGNKDTELRLVKLFRAQGITGWRRQVMIRLRGLGVEKLRQGGKRLSPTSQPFNRSTPFTVRPDFVFRALRVAVFVDGCFWHGCPKHGTRPRGNAAFWKKKLDGNQPRDRAVNAALRRAGWHVLRIWEHELSRKNEARLLRRWKRVLSATHIAFS